MGRTFLVWVIFLLSLLSLLLQVASIFVLYAGVIPWPREVVEALNTVSSNEIAMNLLVSVYDLACAVALFMMRRIALPLFVIGIPVGLLEYGWTIYLHGWEMVANGRSLFTMLVGLTIGLLICFYVWTLDQRGALS